ncbi:ASN_collapsed_G0035770.mRNA.1.CDS.1 [Saccharomyces cerevisiae]|nr:ASN_collapsed_G0035770.mRNA.1.CDS.1 [Saccharomyces cerevisiae]
MMDPWWSPSMEDQAIDRLHRIGQTNSVKVMRFIIQDSIEEKMLRIQEKKRTIGEAMDTDEDERRKRRIEEIQMLFE